MRCVALLALLLAPPSAPAGAPAAPRVVLHVTEQPGERDERVLATLLANLDELELDIVVERHAEPLDLRTLVGASRDVLGRVDARGVLWIDVPEQPDAALGIYVVARDSSQIHARVITAESGDALAIELLANVAAMAAAALGEGRSVELEVPSEAGPPTPPPAQPPATFVIELDGSVTPRLRAWLRARAGYRGQAYAPTLPWMSGASVGLGVRPADRAFVELVADVMVPAHLSVEALELQIQPFPFGLAGGHAWLLPRDWDVELAGRFALEPTRRRTRSGSEGFEPTPARTTWSASLELALSFGVRLAPSARLGLGVGLAVPLVRRDTTIELGEGPATVIAPFPVRPTLWAGFDFDLLVR